MLRMRFNSRSRKSSALRRGQKPVASARESMSQQSNSRCGAVDDANWLLFQDRRATARCATSEERGVSVVIRPIVPTDRAAIGKRGSMPSDFVGLIEPLASVV
jgi:hypothetical protein